MSYLHIDVADKSKLDAKSHKCYFIRCGDAKIGYRFWDDQNRKILRNINVIFNVEAL